MHYLNMQLIPLPLFRFQPSPQLNILLAILLEGYGAVKKFSEVSDLVQARLDPQSVPRQPGRSLNLALKERNKAESFRFHFTKAGQILGAASHST